MSASLAQLQERLQTLSTTYQKIQNDLSAAVDARQKLDAQRSENDLVRKEFEKLSPNNTVYKQIGPVLIQQEQEDAKRDVRDRLSLITDNIKAVEGQLTELEGKAEKVKIEIVETQTQLQRLTQPVQATPAGAIAA